MYPPSLRCITNLSSLSRIRKTGAIPASISIECGRGFGVDGHIVRVLRQLIMSGWDGYFVAYDRDREGGNLATGKLCPIALLIELMKCGGERNRRT